MNCCQRTLICLVVGWYIFNFIQLSPSRVIAFQNKLTIINVASRQRATTTTTSSIILQNNDIRFFSRKQLLKSSLNDDDDNDSSSSSSSSSSVGFLLNNKSDQVVLGGIGIVTSLITLYSESVLKSTGCGLPAGPFGIVGLIEGLSYLSVTLLVSLSIYTKLKTGKGLPSGPYGILGGAEGLSFLAIIVGLIVLILQITNYGYIPNAVPMEGGMCS